TDNQGQNVTTMDLPRFLPGCDKGGGPNPVAIASVTVLADGRVLVTTANPRCLVSPGNTRVRISGVQGLPDITGDYILVPFPDGATNPSNTQFTLADILLQDATANGLVPRPITATGLIGGSQP